MRYVGLVLGLLVVLGNTACELFGEDLFALNFKLPEKEFTLDTGNFVPAALLADPAATIPAVACPLVDCCDDLALTAEDCELFGLACSGGACEAAPEIVLSNPINLAQEAPELQDVAANVPSFTSVKLQRLYLVEYSNSLNYPTPEIEIFIGPDAAVGVDDLDASGNPLVQKIGTVPSLPPGTSCVPGSCDGVDVVLTPDGEQIFELFAQNFRQTFKLFVRASLVIGPGEAVPSGRFDGTITATVSAGLD